MLLAGLPRAAWFPLGDLRKSRSNSGANRKFGLSRTENLR